MSSKQPLLNEEPPRPEPSSGWKRFAKAVCAVALGYILLSAFLKCSPVSSLRAWRDVDADRKQSEPSWSPRKGDGRVLSCADLTSEPEGDHDGIFPGFPTHTSTTSFSLPVSSNIFLMSRGSYGHGSISTELADIQDDTVEIEVITRYYTLDAVRRANVCHLDRGKDGQGVGIYTPHYTHGHIPSVKAQITFDITIRFPKSGSSTNPLVINSLDTDMGIWRHDIASLEGSVMFKSLSLSGANAGIQADSVSGESVQCKTSNAQISGSFNISDTLTLQTSNAHIKVSLRMENGHRRKATRVNMKTSNARIESPITLISTTNTSTASPAAFSVTAITSNSPLTLTFPEAPSSPFSHLYLSATTSNAPAHTTLHPTYEGAISLKTSIFPPSVVQKTTPTDPSGQGRERKVDIRRVTRRVLDGWVWWGDGHKDDAKGTVFVTTSNAYNELELS